MHSHQLIKIMSYTVNNNSTII